MNEKTCQTEAHKMIGLCYGWNVDSRFIGLSKTIQTGKGAIIPGDPRVHNTAVKWQKVLTKLGGGRVGSMVHGNVAGNINLDL